MRPTGEALQATQELSEQLGKPVLAHGIVYGGLATSTCADSGKSGRTLGRSSIRHAARRQPSSWKTAQFVRLPVVFVDL